MKKIVLFGLILISFVGYSQEERKVENKDDKERPIETSSVENEKNKIYATAKIAPEYPGGINAFREFIARKYKALKAIKDLKGQLIVQFVVETDESLTDIKVIKDLGYGTGAEAIRVLKKSKKWKPGIIDGKPVRVLYTLPLV